VLENRPPGATTRALTIEILGGMFIIRTLREGS